MLKRLALTLALALAVVPAAEASRTVKVASHVSIHSRGLTFSGRVTSRNGSCTQHRRVTLHRTNGDVLGSTFTSSRGKWKITVPGSAGISLGHFYATVKRFSQGAAGTIYVCKAARSRTIGLH
jgi:hypothetical protein